MISKGVVDSIARSVLNETMCIWEEEAKKDNPYAVVVLGELEHIRSKISSIINEDFDIYSRPKLIPEPEFDADEPDPSYKNIEEIL